MRSVLPVVTLSTREPAVELAGVDAEVGELADERVGHDLEGQRGERLVVGGVARSASVLVAVARLEMPSTGGTSSGDGR